ncbi:MAG: glycosyltransferase family 2 protein [Pseudomonadota bacterium]
MTRVDICVCTFRRGSLVETLASLMALDLPGDVEASVIVVDNDTTPSAEAAVTQFAATSPLPVRYLHRPAGNISVARNGALDASGARFVAFIDDDETAQAGWLRALLKQRAISAAAVVLGPVEPRFADGTPDWVRKSGLHATRPVWRGGEITTGYTCNVLIDREHPALADRRFDPGLGQSGGEDTDFFSAAHAEGARIAYAEGAVVEEPVPAARTDFRWLARRRYRMGQTHAHVLTTRLGHSRWTALPLALVKAAACGALGLATLPAPRRRNPALLRAALHLGVVAGLAGHRGLKLYGLTQPTLGAHPE